MNYRGCFQRLLESRATAFLPAIGQEDFLRAISEKIRIPKAAQIGRWQVAASLDEAYDGGQTSLIGLLSRSILCGRIFADAKNDRGDKS